MNWDKFTEAVQGILLFVGIFEWVYGHPLCGIILFVAAILGTGVRILLMMKEDDR